MGRSRRRNRNEASTSAAPPPTHNADGSGDEDNEEDEIDTTDPVMLGIRQSMENLKQLLKDILPTCETEEQRSAVIAKLQNLMLDLIRTELSHVKGQAKVTSIDPAAPDNEDVLKSCEELEKICLDSVKTYKESLTPASLAQHRFYKRFEREVEELEERLAEEASTSCSEMEVSQADPNSSVLDLENDTGESSEFIPTVDPITKQTLTDPVRNKICRHIYGRAAMLDLIKSNPNNKIRCTTAGCGNKSFVRPEHLVLDQELSANVRKKVIQEAQRGRRGM